PILPSRRGRDVRGDRLDLRSGQLGTEGRHHAEAVLDAITDKLRGRLRGVEIRPHATCRSRVREGVTARAAGAKEDAAPGGDVGYGRRRLVVGLDRDREGDDSDGAYGRHP